MHRSIQRLGLALGLSCLLAPAVHAQECPQQVPVQGAPVPASLPIFPSDNWWNTDISSAPVDPASASYISFIGGTRGLHPDFGGEESPGSTNIYGFPYVIVDGTTTPKQAVTFEYWDESDGVDSSGNGIPYYPIPSQAITQPHWIEGGAPGNVAQVGDRHLLLIDCTNHRLYELANVHYSSAQQRWSAVAGASFDLNSNARRPEGWTSSDASGMAIFPGLVRYDEAANPAVAEIKHAFRVTVRATNGYVYPASHRAGSTSGALPMGARLRLKTSVNGADPALRTSDPTARKIFRAMQKYGLIVADNGSDMYISGTFDVRWNNGVLNPAFGSLKASDFEVVQLGWKPPAATAPVLNVVSATPNPVTGGQSATGTVNLSAAAPAGGAVVSLASASSAFSVPASVTVPQGASSATFAISTVAPATTATGTLSATYAGVTRTTTVTVNPPTQALPTLSIADVAVSEGNSGTRLLTFTVKLSKASTSSVRYNIGTATSTAAAGSDYVGRSLTGETIAPGATSRTFAVTINGDNAREANETFMVNLSAPVGATIADGQAVGTIVNDDGPTLSIGNVLIAEGNSGTRLATFTVSLSQPSTSNVTYTIATANGSAAAGSDYVARTLTGQSIPAGQTSKTFAVTLNGDSARENNESYFVRLSAVTGATVATSQATGVILNDDGPTLSIGDVSVTEGNSGTKLATFTVRLSQATTSTVSYSIATTNGTATAGSDYVARSLSGQTLAAGQTSRTFTVTINGDTTRENNETFWVGLSAPVGATVLDSQARGLISNDD